MDKAKTDASDAELIAEIRQSLGTAAPKELFTVPATAPVETVEEVPEQPAYQMPEAALRLADHLLGKGTPSIGSAASTTGSGLVVEVEGRRFSVPSDGLELGRSPDPEGSESIVIVDPRVSRRHARFVPSAGGIAVMDLGSTNGTVILRGEERLAVESGPIQLARGDRVATLNDVLLAGVVTSSVD